MRIQQVLGTSAGGVGTHVHALARELSAEHEVCIVAPTSTLTHFGFHPTEQITPLICEMSTRIHPRDWASIRQLRDHIADFHPDIIHAHGFRATLLTLLAARPSGIPVVSSWHNQATGTGLKGLLESRVESYIAKNAALTLGASDDLVDRARQVGGRNVEFASVAAPTPAKISDAEATAVREQLAAEGTLLGLMVGRIAPQKNYELLVKIAAHAPDLPVTIVIAGAEDPQVREHLDAALARLDHGAMTIRFLGPRSDISALMRAADFFLLTSHWEARALVVQEALLAGTPIIASGVGGIPGLVDDAGILLDPAATSAPEDFAEAIRRFTDPQVRARYAQLASTRGQTLPDEHAVAQIMLAHYRQLLGR